MRHLKRKKGIQRPQGHRKAIIANLAKSLITHKRISTTLGKAKSIQPFVERLVTYAKKDGLSAYRLVESKIQDQRLVKRLVEEIAPNYKDRNGGYTRIIKAEPRLGDKAPMAMIEFVGDFTLSEYPKKTKKEIEKESKDSTEKKEKKVVKKVVVDQ